MHAGCAAQFRRDWRSGFFETSIQVNAGPSQASANDHQRMPVLDRLAVLDEDRLDYPRAIGLNLVQQLHRLDDAYCFAFTDGLSDLNESFGPGRWGAVESAYHR